MGGRLRATRSGSIEWKADRRRTVDPCGRVQGHERNQPGRYTAGVATGGNTPGSILKGRRWSRQSKQRLPSVDIL